VERAVPSFRTGVLEKGTKKGKGGAMKHGRRRKTGLFPFSFFRGKKKGPQMPRFVMKSGGGWFFRPIKTLTDPGPRLTQIDTTYKGFHGERQICLKQDTVQSSSFSSQLSKAAGGAKINREKPRVNSLSNLTPKGENLGIGSCAGMMGTSI